MSVLNFTGGILSALGSGFIILCYLALPLRKHFRHVLILNLAVADFINSVNNSASGSLILITKRPLSPTPACVFNGLVGQVTVQAADCAILAIAIVTVYTITKTSSSQLVSGEWGWRKIVGVTSAIWFLPFMTGFIALGKKWYAPVSGNWCWLVDEPVYLRYALTHAWRYLFMLLEIIMYTFLHFFLRRHFRRLANPIVSQVPTSSHNMNTNTIPLSPVEFARQPNTFNTTDHIHVDVDIDVDVDVDGKIESKKQPRRPSSASYIDFSDDSSPSKPSFLSPSITPIPPSITPPPSASQASLKHIFAHRPKTQKSSTNPRERAIHRVLLLNAYPLLYIILWIPGLANRIVEATGNTSRVTQVMQASTQFVGLANALTYGWNERIWHQLKTKYFDNKKQ
ncbi:hypothetical protein ONZ45_g18360 [Pleurotus djamor]|nr:hypothetical protein ONZ45_g18360 [Pleurotus djamor]